MKKGISELTLKFISLIRAIPKGKVATYGQIARLSGNPGYARQVVWTLHSSSRKHKLPWHRVINSQGKIGLKGDRAFLRQRALLLREGVEFDPYGRVDLEKFGWKKKPSKGVRRWRLLRPRS